MRDWITDKILAPSKRLDLVVELMRLELKDRSGLFVEEEGRKEGLESGAGKDEGSLGPG